MICWKYQLKAGLQVLEIPADHTLLSVQKQAGKICLWARVDPKLPKVKVHILAICTGVEFPREVIMSHHVATVQFKKWNDKVEGEENYVWHVFRVLVEQTEEEVVPC